MTKPDRYSIAVDFDGVIHSYRSPWVNHHTIPDPPVPGAIKWLGDMTVKFDVYILSTRCKTWRGRRAMKRWLHKYDEPDVPFAVWEDTSAIGFRVKFAKSKPPALIYLDDRAVRFEGPGTFPTTEQIHRAVPWWNDPTHGSHRG